MDQIHGIILSLQDLYSKKSHKPRKVYSINYANNKIYQKRAQGEYMSQERASYNQEYIEGAPSARSAYHSEQKIRELNSDHIIPEEPISHNISYDNLFKNSTEPIPEEVDPVTKFLAKIEADLQQESTEDIAKHKKKLNSKKIGAIERVKSRQEVINKEHYHDYCNDFPEYFDDQQPGEYPTNYHHSKLLQYTKPSIMAMLQKEPPKQELTHKEKRDLQLYKLKTMIKYKEEIQRLKNQSERERRITSKASSRALDTFNKSLYPKDAKSVSQTRVKSHTAVGFYHKNNTKPSSKTRYSQKREKIKISQLNTHISFKRRNKVRSSQINKRDRMNFNSYDQNQQISEDKERTFGYSTNKSDNSPKFAPHTQFAPTRFRRQPQFRISVPVSKLEQDKDVLKTILKESPQLIEFLLKSHQKDSDSEENEQITKALKKLFEENPDQDLPNKKDIINLISSNEKSSITIFDPFLNIKKSGSTNNPIHTSRRTEELRNNLVSETYKIVHNMLSGKKLRANRTDSPQLCEKVSEKMQLDIPFLKEFIRTITYEQDIPKGDENKDESNGKETKQNEEFSTIPAGQSLVKLKPNYTSSSFYSHKPLDTTSKVGASDYNKVNNLDETISLKKLSDVNKDIRNVSDEVTKMNLLREKKSTKQVANSPLKMNETNEYKDVSFSVPKLVTYNNRKAANRNFNQNTKLVTSNTLRSVSKTSDKPVSARNYSVLIPQSDSGYILGSYPHDKSKVTKKKINKCTFKNFSNSTSRVPNKLSQPKKAKINNFARISLYKQKNNKKSTKNSVRGVMTTNSSQDFKSTQLAHVRSLQKQMENLKDLNTRENTILRSSLESLLQGHQDVQNSTTKPTQTGLYKNKYSPKNSTTSTKMAISAPKSIQNSLLRKILPKKFKVERKNICSKVSVFPPS
ncbi:unnamed protein product [Moneuplotes crassus]|uniref:Uncharacterized protein n=1 Tax=Euplotes crassus TaxID=5936 RepID=A0AAD2D2V3_EUPCR|nr:unnamed protein product [Moneuplotes crassus]